MLAAQKEMETKEIAAKLHSTEMNSTLQQQLLEHVIADQIDDLEIFGIFPNDDGKFVDGQILNICIMVKLIKEVLNKFVFGDTD